MMYFSAVNVELSRLLQVRFIPGQQEGGLVGIMLGQVLVYHNSGQHEFRDRELTKLSLLAADLRRIEAFSPELLRQFQAKYAEDTRAQYFGVRMEIATATILIREQLPFEKNESPDFQVPVEGGRIFIECGSTHLAGGTTSVSEKIAGAIRSKVTLPYFNASTALFLDVTNILNKSLKSREYLEQEHLERIARDEMRDRRVGATVLYFYVLNKATNFFGLAPLRVDNPTADPLLVGFLDRYLSTEGGGSISDYDIPSEG